MREVFGCCSAAEEKPYAHYYFKRDKEMKIVAVIQKKQSMTRSENSTRAVGDAESCDQSFFLAIHREQRLPNQPAVSVGVDPRCVLLPCSFSNYFKNPSRYICG